MEKINFVAKGEEGYEKCPINATNLNKMQDNIEKGIENCSIVEMGTADGGYWVKFDKGFMILTQRVLFSAVKCDFAWGSVYSNSNDKRQLPNFAQAFAEIPAVNISVQPAQAGASTIWSCAPGDAVASKTNAGGFQICRGTVSPSCDVIVNVTAIGKWK